jgi:hypothetical protein
MVHTLMRRCSTSLAIREMQMKTTMRHHSTPTWRAKINKECNSKLGERKGGLTHCCQDLKLTQHFGKPVSVK